MAESSQQATQIWRVTQYKDGVVVAACEFEKQADAKRCADYWARDYSTEGDIIVVAPFQQNGSEK